MFNVFLVGNDSISNELLERLLIQDPIIHNIYQFNDPILAYDRFKILNPDIVFLDIELPVINGIELAKKLFEINTTIKIVFISHYDYYAVEAFELSALDYILKPVRLERLKKTIQRISKLEEDIVGDKKKLTITTFGKLQVYNNIKHISWQGGKVEELFAFLISNYGKSIHKDVIIDTLWDDYHYKRAIGNMHTAVYRARKSLNELGNYCAIEYNSNNYRLSMNNVNFDLMNFYNATRVTEIKKENWLIILKGLEVYTNPFLEENGYIWAYPKQVLFEREYLSTLHKISDYLHKEKMCLEAITILEKLKDNYLFDSNIKSVFEWID